MKVQHDFKAYYPNGRLAISTWTTARITFEIEREAYQARLNRGELLYVDVHSSDPHEKDFRMMPHAS